jgi:hypothetical protein
MWRRGEWEIETHFLIKRDYITGPASDCRRPILALFSLSRECRPNVSRNIGLKFLGEANSGKDHATSELRLRDLLFPTQLALRCR